jgi:hypothetical protein
MLIGYARVSTDDQNLDLQRDALSKAGCEKVFEEHASGVAPPRSPAGRATCLMFKPAFLLKCSAARVHVQFRKPGRTSHANVA